MDLKERLERSRQVSERLAQSTDELNETLAAAEALIADMKLGVYGVVELKAAGRIERSLGFGKFNGVWRLLLVARNLPSVEWEISPLENASREVRVEAAANLFNLVEALITEAEAQVSVVEDANQRAKNFIAGLKEESNNLVRCEICHQWCESKEVHECSGRPQY